MSKDGPIRCKNSSSSRKQIRIVALVMTAVARERRDVQFIPCTMGIITPHAEETKLMTVSPRCPRLAKTSNDPRLHLRSVRSNHHKVFFFFFLSFSPRVIIEAQFTYSAAPEEEQGIRRSPGIVPRASSAPAQPPRGGHRYAGHQGRPSKHARRSRRGRGAGPM
jgi:hypothetical protein